MEWGPTYEATLALQGFSLPAEVVARWTAEAFDGVEHVEHSRSRDHYVAWERERLREMVRECGVGDDDAVQLVDDLHANSKTWTMAAYPEAPAVLDELRAVGVRVVVCSNWDWDLDRAVDAAGLSDRVDALVTSAQAGARKPHPRIYRCALEVAGAPPAHVLFAGDSWRPDVEGPLAGGMRAVHVAREERHDDEPPLPPGAHRVRPSRAALPRLGRAALWTAAAIHRVRGLSLHRSGFVRSAGGVAHVGCERMRIFASGS